MTATKTPKKVVLVAEDDAANAQLLRHMLGVEFDVRVATNGRDALKMALESPLPAVVLLDVMMPGLDGFEVATRLEHDSRFRRPPVIFVTAKDHPLDVKAGMQRGARDYVTKPFRFSDLIEKVRRAANARR